MSLIIPANTLASGGFAVDNSLRFNDGSNDNLTRTLASATNRKTFTVSFWYKRSVLSTRQTIFSQYAALNDNEWVELRFDDDNKLTFAWYTATVFTTNQLFRDVSAWYHILLAVDTTQATDTNRIKLYVNGSQVTSFSILTYPAQNYDTGYNQASSYHIGDLSLNGNFDLNGYLAEYYSIDGQQLDPTSFGEFDEDSGIWKPISVSGLTFGTNGFYLDFEDSAALGDDVSGNGNDFTVNNLTAIDQSTDTCTNNFSTINSLDNYFYAATLSEGNLKQTANASNYSFGTNTFGVSQGKWVVEVKIGGSTLRNALGITDKVSTGTTDQLGDLANAWQYGANGTVYNNGSDIGGSYDTYTADDIIGIYLDLDNNKLYFSKNGTVQNSGTGISITAPSSTTNGVYFFAFGDYGASDDSVNNVNFGSPAFSISSGNTDGEYGNFEYTTTITGDSVSKTFKALCTKNLSEFG
jgi:hypothetical protein